MKKIIVLMHIVVAFAGCITNSRGKSSVELVVAPMAVDVLDVIKAPYACERDEDEEVNRMKMNVDFLVIFKNNTSGTFAFLTEEFSFGYYNLSLEIKNEKGEIVELTKRTDHFWSRNFLFYRYVGPGQSMAYPVTIDYRVWKDIPEWLWQVGRKYSVRAKFVGGYLLEGDESQYDQHTNVVKLGRDCGELVSEWRELRFRD